VQGRRHYAWVVAGVTFVVLLGAAGFRSAAGVLIVPLEEDLGWSRTIVSLGVSVNLVLYGLSGPFAAALMARFGLRRVVAGALCFIGTGAALTAAMSSPWQFVLLWGVVVGAGSGCLATVLAATVASRWFVRRRGLVTGALIAATATGQLAFLPVLGWLAEDVGWQAASLVVASGALVVVPLALRFLRDRPEDVGLVPYGAGADYETPAPGGNPVAAAMQGLRHAAPTSAFWLLAGSFFVCGASTNGLIGTHFIAAGHDHGLSETRASALLALVGIFDVVGTVASGWLTDRFDPRRLLLGYYGFRGLSLLFLDDALGTRGVGLWGFVFFYGLDWVATVPPTVALCNKMFGDAGGGVIYGWVFASHQLGAAVAASAAGAIRTATGSYERAFQGAAILCIAAALAVQVLRHERPVEVTPAVAA
jgi:sugar phosphate permease